MSTIAFTRGVPSADLLPVAAISAAAVTALELDAPGALAYAPGGYLGLREWIAERHGVSAKRVVLFNGSLEGVGMLVEQLFSAEGGSAIVEDPTYDRSLIAFAPSRRRRDRGAARGRRHRPRRSALRARERGEPRG